VNTPSFRLGNTPKRFRKVFRVSLSLILVATLMVPVTAWGENDMSVPEQEKSSETPAIPEDSMLSERDVIGIESEVEKPLDASKESSGSGVIDPIVDQPSANVEKTPETPPTGDPEKSVRSANGVAQVDSNEAMREAVVNVEAGSTIQLAGDIDLGTEMLTISKNLTLDLAGHTLNSQVEGGGYALNGSVTSFKPAIEIKDTSFTLQDSAGGGVATTKGGSVFAVSGSSEDPNNLIAMFVVKGGTVKSEYKPIMTSRASVLLDGGVIESKWDGIYATMSSQVTVLAGSISVDHGPDSPAGAVNLSYGSSLNVEGGTLTTTQCPVVFCYANWSTAPTSTVSISGGTLQTGKLEGAYALSLLNKTSADMPGVIVDISGGSIIGPWYFAGPRETLLHIGENAYLSEGFEVKEGTPFCTPVEGVARKPIEGGTFGFDPSQYVNTGTYSVTEKEGTWTVAPREDRADTSWYKTDEKDFTINTSQQLAGLAVLVNEGNDFEGKTITLANDINLSAFENWIPIGTGSGASLETATGVFRGIFDGGNKKISGLKISGDSSYVGLFGTVTTKDSNTPQATVRNVTLVDPRVGGATYVGGLIGHAHRADVQNCHVAGEINISGNKYVGGLVGHGYVSITGSSITGAGSVRGIYQNGGGYSVGGIIGFTGESNEPENLISECSVSGVTVSGTARTGGLVGYQHGGVGILKCQVSDVTVAFETANVPEDFLTGDMASTAGIGGLVGVANGQVGNDPSSNLTPPGELSNCTISNTTLVTDGAGTPAAAGYLYGKLSNSAAKPTVTNCVAVGCTGSTVASDNTVYKGSDGSVACVSVKRGEEELIFFSLKEAFDAAQSGDILTMTSDVVIGSDGIATLGEGKSITFDMAAKKITVTADFKGRPLMNYGTLTVCGNGAIDSSASELGGYGAINNYGELTIVDGLYRGSVKAVGASIFNRSGAALVVKGGTLDGATCALYNEGKATINGGVFDSISCNHIKVNGESIHSYTIRSFGELQFNDGSVTGVQGALSVSSGEAEINGGIFTARRINQDTCTFHALYVAGEVGEAKCDIKGGTFKSEYRQALWVGNDNTNGDGGLNEPATANIYGGSFWNTECSTIAFLTGPATGTPRVYGGEFSGRVVNQQDSAEVDLSEYVAPSSKVIEEGGRVKVVERTAENSIAKLGDLYFDDLKEALTAAGQMEPKAVIELLSDTTVSSSLAVPDGKDVTLKGNGKTITGKGLRGSNTDKNALFLVSGNLTLENVNVKNVGIGVRAQGVGSVVTVTDSDIEAGYYALALRNKEQKLKVSNSTLTGWAGIMTSAGDVTLNNNTGASIDVTGSTINCKPVTDTG
jgi:hypothetical protein